MKKLFEDAGIMNENSTVYYGDMGNVDSAADALEKMGVKFTRGPGWIELPYEEDTFEVQKIINMYAMEEDY